MTEVVTEKRPWECALKANDTLNSWGFIANEKIWMESGLASNFREGFRSQVFAASIQGKRSVHGASFEG